MAPMDRFSTSRCCACVCADSWYDFSALSTSAGTLVPGEYGEKYWINICGAGIHAFPACTDAVLCFDATPLARNHALPAPVFFSDTAKDAAKLTYNNGHYSGAVVHTAFEFRCTVSAADAGSGAREAAASLRRAPCCHLSLAAFFLAHPRGFVSFAPAYSFVRELGGSRAV